MANIVYIATSIDGYIARDNGAIDWLLDIPNPTGSDYGYAEFMKRIDGIIMGRNTFQSVMGFEKWPYPKPVFVLSNTLQKIPDHLSDEAKIVNGNLIDIVDRLNSEGFRNLYIDGGKTIQSFLQMDMIDEMIITRIPIVLGSGIPLFTKSNKEIAFEHIHTDIYNNGLVKSRYVRSR